MQRWHWGERKNDETRSFSSPATADFPHVGTPSAAESNYVARGPMTPRFRRHREYIHDYSNASTPLTSTPKQSFAVMQAAAVQQQQQQQPYSEDEPGTRLPLRRNLAARRPRNDARRIDPNVDHLLDTPTEANRDAGSHSHAGPAPVEDSHKGASARSVSTPVSKENPLFNDSRPFPAPLFLRKENRDRSDEDTRGPVQEDNGNGNGNGSGPQQDLHEPPLLPEELLEYVESLGRAPEVGSSDDEDDDAPFARKSIVSIDDLERYILEDSPVLSTRDALKGAGPGRLDIVDLSHMRIAELPGPVMSILRSRVVMLSLSFNFFRDLPDYFNPIFLRFLNLRGNTLTAFPACLMSLPNLEHLDISRNKIRKLPSNPGNLIRLKSLSISKNKIRKLPLYIAHMPYLKCLHIDGNPIEWPPKNVLPSNKLLSSAAMTLWLSQLREYILEWSQKRSQEHSIANDPSLLQKRQHPDPRKIKSSRSPQPPSTNSADTSLSTPDETPNDKSQGHQRTASSSLLQNKPPAAASRTPIAGKKSLPDLRRVQGESSKPSEEDHRALRLILENSAGRTPSDTQGPASSVSSPRQKLPASPKSMAETLDVYRGISFSLGQLIAPLTQCSKALPDDQIPIENLLDEARTAVDCLNESIRSETGNDAHRHCSSAVALFLDLIRMLSTMASRFVDTMGMRGARSFTSVVYYANCELVLVSSELGTLINKTLQPKNVSKLSVTIPRSGVSSQSGDYLESAKTPSKHSADDFGSLPSAKQSADNAGASDHSSSSGTFASPTNIRTGFALPGLASAPLAESPTSSMPANNDILEALNAGNPKDADSRPQTALEADPAAQLDATRPESKAGTDSEKKDASRKDRRGTTSADADEPNKSEGKSRKGRRSRASADASFISHAPRILASTQHFFEKIKEALERMPKQDANTAEFTRLCATGIDIVSRLVKAVEHVKASAVDDTFQRDACVRVGEEAYQYVQTVILCARLAKSISVSPESAKLRDYSNKLTITTREFAKRLTHCSSAFKPNIQP